MLRMIFKVLIVVVLMTAGQVLIASAETESVHVSFTARGFIDEVTDDWRSEVPAKSVSGFFTFDFDFDQPEGNFKFIPTSVNLIIAEETNSEKDFSGKVLTVSVRWSGSAFESIWFWAGIGFFPEGDDFVLKLYPEGGGQNEMRYSLLAHFHTFRSRNISFEVNGCNNITDSDGDGVNDCDDLCPSDPTKTRPRRCGCGRADIDTDGDEKLDCMDANDDDDALYDYEEWGPDQNNPQYDGNSDGTADHLQSNVVSFHTFNDQNYVTLESPAGTLISNCTAEDNPSESNAPLDVDFSDGFFEFTITGVDNDDVTTVILHFPVGTTFDTYYKYGPIPSNDIDHWYEFLNDGQTGAKINGNVITLNFVDGQKGDDDLTADGIVIDIGGPAVSLDPSGGDGDGTSGDGGGTSGGGGGGCFIGTAVNSLE